MPKALSKDKRTIGSSIMEQVMLFAPNDPFRLADNLLNKVYTTVDVNETEFGKTKSFMIMLEDEDGQVINISAAALKKARMMKKADIDLDTPVKEQEHIFTRSKADAIWNGSSYYHSKNMKKDEDFVIPAKIKFRYAVIAEDQEGEMALNPFNYKNYRTVVDHYQKSETFPTFEDFKEELLKETADGRIEGLPKGMKTPAKQSWIKGEVSDYRHTLIMEDFES